MPLPTVTLSVAGGVNFFETIGPGGGVDLVALQATSRQGGQLGLQPLLPLLDGLIHFRLVVDV